MKKFAMALSLAGLLGMPCATLANGYPDAGPPTEPDSGTYHQKLKGQKQRSRAAPAARRGQNENENGSDAGTSRNGDAGVGVPDANGPGGYKK